MANETNHRDVTSALGIHLPFAAEYANAAARAAATGFQGAGGAVVAFALTDIGKCVIQVDTWRAYILTAIDPVWTPIADASGSAAAAQAAAIAASCQRASNLSDLANAGTARANLGLGTAATQASSAFDVAGAATAAQAAAIAASCQRASNLSDLANAGTARTNLGVGSDAAAGTPSMRSLGDGAAQACAGNDPRLNLNFKGVWDNSIVYAKGDIVYNDLSGATFAYLAINANNGTNPISDAGANWAMLGGFCSTLSGSFSGNSISVILGIVTGISAGT